MKNHPFLAATIFIFLIAAGATLRLYRLEERPMHCDEGNQAVKTGKLLDEGDYAYDPHEHHGPTLYYAALISAKLRGQHTFRETTEATYRIVPVLFSLLTLLLFVGLRKQLGITAFLWATLFGALSHGLVFYSRYFIQESLFVCFAGLIIVSGWRYWYSRHWGWAVLLGLGLGLLQSTKETWVLILAAMAGALVVVKLTSGKQETPRTPLNKKHLGLICLIALTTSVLFYSSFGTHWRGVLDSLLAYKVYFTRAEGAGSSGIHEKPWYYYFSLLFYTHREAGPRWSEGLILVLAAIGMLAPWKKRAASDWDYDPALWRFLAVYTLLLAVGFSLIPYKTPWNVLVILHGMTLLAGLGAYSLFRWSRFRVVRFFVLIGLLGGAAHLGHQTCLGIFRYAADVRNPYAYAHTSTKLKKTMQQIEDIAAFHPEKNELLIYVIQPDGDYWPIPWYLRGFEHVGFWHQLPSEVTADIVIAPPALGKALQPRLNKQYHSTLFSLRPGILRHCYVEQELWNRYIRTRINADQNG